MLDIAGADTRPARPTQFATRLPLHTPHVVQGADAALRDRDGHTAIDLAVAAQQHAVAKYLLQAQQEGRREEGPACAS